MSTHDSLSIAGGWLGTYYYRGGDAWQQPCRFEATFTLPRGDGRFSGTILDDGRLGEAGVNGAQEGLRVRFTKIYLRPPAGAATGPVEYEGTLSEDGKSMRGTWTLTVHIPGHTQPLRSHGVWEAHREWSEEIEAEPEAAPEAVSATRERVQVAHV